jgi:hypothetical protein
MSNDSFYAQGVGMIKMKAGIMENKRSFTGTTLKLLQCMTQAGAPARPTGDGQSKVRWK